MEYLNEAINWWVFSGLAMVAFLVWMWYGWEVFKENCIELFDLPENILKMLKK